MAQADDPGPSDVALAEAVLAVAEVGARTALRWFRRPIEVEHKSGPTRFDPVTAGDREAEAAMRSEIEDRFPEHGILGEEHGEKLGSSRWRWVLDPIDGTRGFMSGTPTWTTLVGLERDGRPLYGAIVQPFIGERWLGFPGGATYARRGEDEVPCAASTCAELDAARLATTDPRPRPEGQLTDEEARRFLALGRRCRVARFGNDAYAYGLLASGSIDLVVEAGLERYDVAALIPVVRGAGGVVTSWSGADPSNGGRIIAASTPALHAAARALLGAS